MRALSHILIVGDTALVDLIEQCFCCNTITFRVRVYASLGGPDGLVGTGHYGNPVIRSG